jgi:hypothetical protein
MAGAIADSKAGKASVYGAFRPSAEREMPGLRLFLLDGDLGNSGDLRPETACSDFRALAKFFALSPGTSLFLAPRGGVLPLTNPSQVS